MSGREDDGGSVARSHQTQSQNSVTPTDANASTSTKVQQQAKDFVKPKMIYHDYGEVTDESDIGHRLHKTPKQKTSNNKEEGDAIVSDLSGETLRWMKKRRDFDADKKLVISAFREKQLREMFQSLDYETSGALDLEELTQAVSYVQEKTKHSKGLEQFRNIQQTFVDMDDNGDGTVDFSEFLRAMTGTTQSTFDKASEFDVDRLFSYFIEYGEIKQREVAWKKIAEAQQQANPDNILRPKSAKDDSHLMAPADTMSIKHFKTLFGANDEADGKYASRAISKREAVALSIKKSAQLDNILQDFIAENVKSPPSHTIGDTLDPLTEGGETLSSNDNKGKWSNFTDEEYLALQERLREERKAIIQQRTLILAEAGLLNNNKRKPSISRPSTRSQLRNSASLPSTLPSPTRGGGSFSLGSSLDRASTASLDQQRSLHRGTFVPAETDTKKDLALKSTAKREAYDLLRQSRAADESQWTPLHQESSALPQTVSASAASALTRPSVTTRSSFATNKQFQFSQELLQAANAVNGITSLGEKDGLRLPSIRQSITTNSSALNRSANTNPSFDASSSHKKPHMIRASFAF